MAGYEDQAEFAICKQGPAKGNMLPWEIFKFLACKRHFLHFLNCFITSVNIQFRKCKTVASHLNISRPSSFFLWSRKMAVNEGRRLSECLDEASRLVKELFGEQTATTTPTTSRVAITTPTSPRVTQTSSVGQAVKQARTLLTHSSRNGLFPRLNQRQRERLRGGNNTNSTSTTKKARKDPEIKAFEFVLLNFDSDDEWVISSENTVLRGLIEIDTSSTEAEIRREICKATKLQYPLIEDHHFVFLRANRRRVSIPLNCRGFDYKQLKLLAGQGAVYVNLKAGFDCLLVDEKEVDEGNISVTNSIHTHIFLFCQVLYYVAFVYVCNFERH